MTKKEIEHTEDIKLLVDEFYEKVRQDDLLAAIFNHVIKDKWPEHLKKMYRFWQTVLLDEHTYKGSPFLPHAKLPVSKEHFSRWLCLFNQTVDELFKGEVAEEAKMRAGKMAQMFQYKIEYYNKHQSKPLI